MKKKFLIVFLSALIVIIMPAVANATDKTQDEALAWAQSQVGKALDYDGVYGAQCVDLIKYYYAYLGVTPVQGNGCDYATNALPAGWQRLKGATPKPGDILVYSASSSNSAGHVAIYESDYSHYNQNVSGKQQVVKCTWHYTQYNPYWGVIRPNFRSNTPATPAPIPDEPVITASAEYAKESTSVTVSWSNDSKAAKYEYFLAEYPKAYAYTTNSGHGFTTDTSIKFSNLICGNYSVFIHGISSDGERSEQSNWVTFEINADDYVPTKVVTYNNHIYALYDYTSSWTFAKDLCTSLGGHLATITSSQEERLIEDLIGLGSKDSYWLGATDLDRNEKDFQWITGERFSYTNWYTNQPSASGDRGTKDHFLEIRKSYNNKWNDVYNINKTNKGFILEIDTGEYSPVATQTYNGSQYLLFDKNTTWSEAQVFCEVLGGHLAYANTEEENEFIKTFVKNGQRGWYYLGGQKINGVWKWADGSKADAITWAPTADSWTGTNLMMYKSGTCIGLRNAYYPKANLDIMGFVCEIEAGDEPTPTPTVTTTPTQTPISTPIPAPACFTVDYGDGYADITNISDSMQSAAVITAEYSGGVLVSVNAGNMTFAAGEKRSIIINNNTKVFVWDSLSGMKPLAEE